MLGPKDPKSPLLNPERPGKEAEDEDRPFTKDDWVDWHSGLTKKI